GQATVEHFTAFGDIGRRGARAAQQQPAAFAQEHLHAGEAVGEDHIAKVVLDRQQEVADDVAARVADIAADRGQYVRAADVRHELFTQGGAHADHVEG